MMYCGYMYLFFYGNIIFIHTTVHTKGQCVTSYIKMAVIARLTCTMLVIKAAELIVLYFT